MIDLTGVQHNTVMESIVDVLCNRTQNKDRGWFRVLTAFFMGKMASSMGTTIVTKDRGEIPVNIYALLLATSGYGKGYSISIIENEFLSGFKKRFMNETLPVIATENIRELALEKSQYNNTHEDDEFEKLAKEFRSYGNYPFTFDSGTVPAVKQLRSKLLMSVAGAINLQIDEIGSNLISNLELLNLFLELYDLGQTKQKLTKNTTENQRTEELDGRTPTNMLLFGTPAKLQDGSATEDMFESFLEVGYGRRCLFAKGEPIKDLGNDTPEEVYRKLTNPQNDQITQQYSDLFTELADPSLFGQRLIVDDPVGIRLMEYKMACEAFANTLQDHEETRKAEMSHRYFRALKLAGAYAFIKQEAEISMDTLHEAILLTEESGAAFQKILEREKPYIKLAKYLAGIKKEVTHAELLEALPFYGKNRGHRDEMMNLAIAWGYKNHIVIKKTIADGIEFFQAETLKETDINRLVVSTSGEFAYNYVNDLAPFDSLELLAKTPDLHWANHHFVKGHRSEDSTVMGFNMVVLDVDEGVSVETAHDLLKEYKHFIYTTKRHTNEQHRFRVIIPINYHLELDKEDYKEFINSLTQWLPFSVDESVNQRAKKWLSNPDALIIKNDQGELLDVSSFIPKTSRNDAHIQQQIQLGSLDNMERWFASRMTPGQRNNQMHKYARVLVDSGLSLNEVKNAILHFNKKLKGNALPEEELHATVLATVAKQYA